MAACEILIGIVSERVLSDARGWGEPPPESMPLVRLRFHPPSFAFLLLSLAAGAGFAQSGGSPGLSPRSAEGSEALRRIWDDKLRSNPGLGGAPSPGSTGRSPSGSGLPRVNIPESSGSRRGDPDRSRRSIEREQFTREEQAAARLARAKNMVGIPEPILSPSGDRIVAMVNNERTMTMSDLDFRLAILLKSLPSIQSPSGGKPLDPVQIQEFMDKRRYELSLQIMDDWALNNVLVLEAGKRGFKVEPAEVEKSLAAMSETSHGGEGKARQEMTAFGIPEEQLRAETHDGLLVEKLVTDVVHKNFTPADYRKAFDLDPGYWMLPPRVRAFHVFKSIDSTMTEKQRSQAKSQIDGLYKQLKKKNPDYKALQNQSDVHSGVAIGDTGWIAGDSPASPGLKRALFSMEVGQTSRPFSDGLGMHVVRILEREDGSKRTFEDAMPQIEAYLYDKMKDAVYDSVKNRYEIRMNSGGLSRWKQIPREEYLRTRAKGDTGSTPGALPAGSERDAMPAEGARVRPPSQIKLSDPASSAPMPPTKNPSGILPPPR